MRISDWSSDVCSSDLDDAEPVARIERAAERHRRLLWDRGHGIDTAGEVGRRYRDGADRAYDYAAPIGAGAGAGRRRDDKLRAVRRSGVLGRREIGRAHVCTPVTNAPLVCRLLLENKKYKTNIY